MPQGKSTKATPSGGSHNTANTSGKTGLGSVTVNYKNTVTGVNKRTSVLNAPPSAKGAKGK